MWGAQLAIQQTTEVLIRMTLQGLQVQPFSRPHQTNLIIREYNRAQTLSFNLLHNIEFTYLISLRYYKPTFGCFA